MKRISRFFSGTTAAVVSLSALLSVGFTGVASAAATYTCAWTGAGDGANFSDAANWSSCNGAAPVPADTDTLVFDLSALTANKTLNNDISGLAVTDLSFTGDNTSSAYPMLTIGGSAVTLNGTVTSDATGASHYIAADIVLGADVNFTSDWSIYIGGSQTIDLNGHNLTVPVSENGWLNKVTGTGNIAVDGALELWGANTGWTGDLNVSAGAYISLMKDSVAATNNITVANGGSMYLCGFNGASVASSLTIGGSGRPSEGAAIFAVTGCFGGGGVPPAGLDPAASVNWTGAITLTANTVVGGSGEFKVSGPLSGNYTLTEKDGEAGKVTIASSSNTSGTSNGTQTSATKTTEYKDNSPTTSIYVSANNIAVVSGTYGNTSVAPGGTLKGTGTVADLSVESEGIIAPGNSPGCITASTLTLAGEYQFELGGTDACTGYDQIKVTGTTGKTVTIDNTTAVITTSRYNDYTPTQGQVFTIVDNQGSEAVDGTFKDLAEGATFEQNGVVFKISYVGGDGNDITLTVQNVPTVPDTGFALVSSNPVLSLGLMTAIAGLMIVIARRTRLVQATTHNKSARRKK